jgi:hypothetical protein
VVRFLADVQGFLRGTDQVEEALRDTARQQDAAADAGEDAARRLATAYDRAGDKIKREARETHRSVRDGFADSGREAGAEFTQNLGQSISSGDLSSIATDTAGGLAATFGMAGPIGIAFAALATGASLVFQQIQAQAEAMREAVKSEFDAMFADADRRATLDRRLTEQFGSVQEGVAKIRELAEGANVPFATILDAFADGGDKAQTLLDKMRAQEEILNRSASTSTEWGGSMADAVASTVVLEEKLALVVEATATAARDAEAYAAAMKLGAYYAQQGSSYAVGGSTYQSQVPGLYQTEKR